MATYKTPGVYVEEISLFPPSVAEVETAIPAFIGYTEKAETLSAQSLSGIPTKIKSLLEFETYFGKGPKTNLTEVILDENNNFSKATIEPKYYLYDSVRLFFDNGGGNCYVVSVGVYPNGIDADQLKTGIEALKKYDEPTILLFPDAAGLSADKLGGVQTAALMQCTALGDRVCVFDSQQDDPNGIKFRDNIGINNLKYGAAYTPWLKVNYGKSVSYEDVKTKVKKVTQTISLRDLTTDNGIQATIQNLENALDDVRTLSTVNYKSVSANYDQRISDYKNSKTATSPNPVNKMQNVFGYLLGSAGLANLINNLLQASSGEVKGTDLRNDIGKSITNLLKNAFSELIGNDKELTSGNITYVQQWSTFTTPAAASQWEGIFNSTSSIQASEILKSDETVKAECDAILSSITTVFYTINSAIDTFLSTAAGDENTTGTDKYIIKSGIDKFLNGSVSINARYKVLLTDYQKVSTTNDIFTKMQAIFTFLFQLAGLINGLLDSAGIKGTGLKKTIQDSIIKPLKDAFSTLINNEQELALAAAARSPSYTVQWKQIDSAVTEWNGIFTNPLPLPPTSTLLYSVKCDAFLPSIQKNFAIINEAINSFILAAAQYVKTYEKTLYDIFPIYQNLIKGINDTLTEVPPSGAIAGIYAMVDNQRGVWKAPANVSLASVVGPTYNFDSSETDALNIDANAGKSINAIRAFSGKGTLVWGARTLAGNDNEWRYVPVRRFFNLVEESIKKSTYWAVFEPNDANLWMKVRGMIENYLTQKWREGALAGATTKEAFFVKCGLGTTMTAQDILEGRLNVEIGMAVVRPAEFIVLKFSHKLQTS